jgi:TonB family protein
MNSKIASDKEQRHGTRYGGQETRAKKQETRIKKQETSNQQQATRLSEEKKYKNYSAADIEKYHKGLLSPGEMNELEKAALDDPFLADALEGYKASAENVSSDLSELKKKLEERVSEKKVISIAPSGSSFKWWKAAVAVVMLGGLGYFVFQISNGNKNNEVATLEKKQNAPQKTPPGDSGKFSESPHDSASNLKSTPYAVPGEQEIGKAKTSKEKLTSKESPQTETSKGNLAVEITKPASPGYKQEKDSIGVERSLEGIAPAAVEKRSAVADNNENRGIVTYKKEDVLNNRQANYFNGRIKDANNNPLPFANITNTRDNVGTYADAQGIFTLVSPDSVLNVQVRSVGFENSTVQLKNSAASNEVVLQENKTAPDRVLSFQKPDTSRSRMANIKFEELEPADGWSNYNTYLANNINVPSDLKRENEAKGQVQVSFEVNQHGDPINIRVEKSLCAKCDEEAIRAVKQGPKWKKKNKDKKAKRITISVPFDTDE